MQTSKLSVLAVTSLLFGLACSHEKPAASQNIAYQKLAATTTMAVVPTNTSFVVAMKEPLSSDTATAGRTFTAELAEPIVAGDGRVAARPGSEVRGHIVAVQTGQEPRLAIAFDSIATRAGGAMFGVRVVAAREAPVEIASVRRPDEVDADLVVRQSSAAIGGGPATEGAPATATRTVSLPKGAKLELVLAVPLSLALPR